MPYVYMLTDDNNKVLYTGVTNDLERRMYEHRNGEVDGFTKRYALHKLVYCEQWNSITDAIHREKQLKGWKRSKKDALIADLNPKWEELMPYK